MRPIAFPQQNESRYAHDTLLAAQCFIHVMVCWFYEAVRHAWTPQELQFLSEHFEGCRRPPNFPQIREAQRACPTLKARSLPAIKSRAWALIQRYQYDEWFYIALSRYHGICACLCVLTCARVCVCVIFQHSKRSKRHDRQRPKLTGHGRRPP